MPSTLTVPNSIGQGNTEALSERLEMLMHSDMDLMIAINDEVATVNASLKRISYLRSMQRGIRGHVASVERRLQAHHDEASW